ncbi:general secretion pathway protein GspN [Rhodanobacter sp. FW510-R12]|uniref:type II secretion system protein N n=1 Tax=unclassified Rhodanobacter TaxID=2621553 RepID=UPI0007AA1608|nr:MULTISPECIES: type II secretion system protein N [unclassified Rhodanobacter]KZC16756.1 general secretion pathway protein GspN [Rhodanobacter sp. FW104-R8]KZC27729.1 general secretion pathway protein GspN [Rhodanobacter sp. FW510-T8]KZC30108.1 general secretion pathway protein GspN [Rhodanobacter sp. FW510-R10]
MKPLRTCLVGLGVLAPAAALLLWFLPARWALPWIEPRLHGLQLQQVQGSLWDGRAGAVMAADGRRLGQLQWRLSRRSLLGQPQGQLRFEGAQLWFSGGVRRLADARLAIDDLDARVQLAALDAYTRSPLGQPRGELQLAIAHALLQGGWPVQLQAWARWPEAVVRTRDGNLALGALQGQAQATSGVIRVQLQDDGHGPLQAAGELQLSPLGWRLDATLRARQTDPTLRRWLAALGPVAADGSVHVRRGGGLAGSVPASPTN